MRIISLDYNPVTKSYMIADGPDIYKRAGEDFQSLESTVQKLKGIIPLKKKVTLRVHTGFPPEVLGQIKIALQDREIILEENYEPEYRKTTHKH